MVPRIHAAPSLTKASSIMASRIYVALSLVMETGIVTSMIQMTSELARACGVEDQCDSKLGKARGVATSTSL